MKSFFAALLFLIFSAFNLTYAQQFIDRVKFFTDTSLINATLTFNIKKVLAEKDKIGYMFPATFTCKMDDGLNVNDHISIEVRGHSRRAYCYLPPLELIYNNNSSAAFYHLKALKLVNTCMVANKDDQYLLKEFLIYKIYNLVTDKSFRVRLLNLSFRDSSGMKKTITEHAFLMEDIKQLAKRNDCTDWKGKNFGIAAIDRTQMTIAAIFEYMTGNTDWSVLADHNIKVIRAKKDSIARPYAIPYDFDSAGLVNTNYAVPDARLGLENVRQRLYMGLSVSPEELNKILDVFNKQKVNIYALINNFSLLTPATKKDMTGYLDSFFLTINNPADAKQTFVANTR